MTHKSLKYYRKNKDVHYINKNFKNIKAIHKNPWIFEVSNLLSNKECNMLINKSKNAIEPSRCKSGLNYNNRISYSTRLHFNKVKKIQNRFSDLLNIPIQNFEALKIQMYNPMGFFKLHNDGFSNSFDENGNSLFPCVDGLYPNRIVTLIVYLNDVTEGGATVFPKLNLRFQPKKGTGLIFMPSELPSGRNKGKIIPNLIHESDVVYEEKYICTQWAWPSNYDIYKDPCNGLFNIN